MHFGVSCEHVGLIKVTQNGRFFNLQIHLLFITDPETEKISLLAATQMDIHKWLLKAIIKSKK